MMMQGTRKDVDREVTSQCDGGNQGTAQKKLHLNVRQSSGVRLSSCEQNLHRNSVLLNHTQCRQVFSHRQDRVYEIPPDLFGRGLQWFGWVGRRSYGCVSPPPRRTSPTHEPVPA